MVIFAFPVCLALYTLLLPFFRLALQIPAFLLVASVRLLLEAVVVAIL